VIRIKRATHHGLIGENKGVPAKGRHRSKSQLTPPTLMTNSEILDFTCIIPILMAWIGEIGYIWKKDSRCSQIRPVLQEARERHRHSNTRQWLNATRRQIAHHHHFNYGCVVGLVGACPLLSYITPPIIEWHLRNLQNDRRPPPLPKNACVSWATPVSAIGRTANGS
jgi:hypothetical protein